LCFIFPCNVEAAKWFWLFWNKRMKLCFCAAASWVKKSRRGKKLQFSDRQLQISDRGVYGCLKFQFCPYKIKKKIAQKVGHQHKCCMFGRKLSENKKVFQQFFDSPKFRGGGNCPFGPSPSATTPLLLWHQWVKLIPFSSKPSDIGARWCVQTSYSVLHSGAYLFTDLCDVAEWCPEVKCVWYASLYVRLSAWLSLCTALGYL